MTWDVLMMRRYRFSVLALAAALLLVSCRKEDPRVKNLAVGIPKDSALSVMGVKPTDHGQAYLMGGKYIEAFIVRKEGVEGPSDSLTRGDLTPVVVVDGKLAGWGWKHWDSVADANKIAVKQKK
jgi:hypothetical protein